MATQPFPFEHVVRGSTVVGGLELVQRRHLVTEISGPDRACTSSTKGSRDSAWSRYDAPGLCRRSRRRCDRGCRGNSLIDLGSGIAVTTVGNSSPQVVAAVAQQLAAFTHTCFMVTPYEGYVAVAEALNGSRPALMRSDRRCSTRAPRRWKTQ